MRHETQVELIREALENIRQKRSDAEGQPFELSIDRYLSPEILERERSMFRTQPIVVGFASQVARPGDFLTHDASGVPILVARDREGALRAFINACRHRGTRLEDASCGNAERSFSCPYHGWTYDLGGRLTGVPHRDEFAGVDLDARGLVELPVAERFGLVFARATPGAPIDARWFGSFAEDLDRFGLASHVLHSPSVRTHQLNWKLMSDGSWESYHFRITHAKTIAPLFFDNTGVFDFEEPHLRMILAKRTMLDLLQTPEESWEIRAHANLLYGIFPNTILLVQPDHAMVISIWPESVDRSRLLAGMLIPEAPASEKARAHWRKNEEIFWAAIEEDISMGERIQSTLASGANQTLLFGKNEHLVAKFHRAIANALKD